MPHRGIQGQESRSASSPPKDWTKTSMTKFDHRYFDRIKATVSSTPPSSARRSRVWRRASPKARAIAAGGGALAVVIGGARGSRRLEHERPRHAPSPSMATAEHISEAAKTNGAKATSKAVSVSVPSEKQLHPVAIQGSQSDIPLSGDQMRNAQKDCCGW